MKLVIVESPAKVRTIKKYLGKGYRVAASMGHIVDLPKSELGVDVEKKFEPKYIVTNRKALKYLKAEFRGVDTLLIASDLDREGEAIGWHIAQRLNVINKRGRLKNKNVELKRIVFSSITKEAIEEAMKSPRKIDLNLVDAQQSRRILDRLVGYKLSPLLWKKISYGLSAGRVQSVAVRLIVDREEERKKFKAEEYWSVLADLLVSSTRKKPQKIICKIKELSGRLKQNKKSSLDFEGIKFELIKVKTQKAALSGEKQVQKIIDYVVDKKWIVTAAEKKKTFRYPKPPFITSTLQRTAVNLFGYPAKKTMRLAQRLYEAGLITYMRTDSLNIAAKELKKIRSFIKSQYGEKYLSSKSIFYKSKLANAEEAHEAIRPAVISKSAKILGLTGEQKRIYELIRDRVLACQMSPAQLENATLDVEIDDYLFRSKGQRVVFEGYLKVGLEKLTENILPNIKSGQQLYPKKLIGQQHFTLPPARYTEASLIKVLEKYGIGRPSTYAPTISTILARKYVVKEGRYFLPTEIGMVVIKLLKKYFAQIVDTGFTAEMESNLDKVAAGTVDRAELIKEFYTPFIKDVIAGEKKIKRSEFTVLGKSKFKCPNCGKRMVKKIGRFGTFLSCTNFPKCKGMRSIDGKSEEDRKKEVLAEAKSEVFKSKYLPAPESKDGVQMILRSGRFGKFWAHPEYPKVKESASLLLKEKCPKCGSALVEKRGRGGRIFLGCSGYPKCRFIQKSAEGKKGKEAGR